MPFNRNNFIVDVVMVVYNQEEYISKAIESVLMQESEFGYKLIISDDCSTDQTFSICTEYHYKYPNIITLINNHNNLGLAANYYKAFKITSSKYIAFLEGDDYWVDKFKLQKEIDILERNSEIGLVHTAFTVLYEDGTTRIVNKCKIKRKKLEGFLVKSLIKENTIAPLTVCFKRDLIINKIDFNLFVKNKYKTIDYALWLEIAANSKIYYINEITSVYRKLNSSVSNTSDPIKILQFYDTALDVNNNFFIKYPQYSILKLKALNYVNISIINRFVFLNDFQIAKNLSIRLNNSTFKGIILKALLKKLIFIKLFVLSNKIIYNLKLHKSDFSEQKY